MEHNITIEQRSRAARMLYHKNGITFSVKSSAVALFSSHTHMDCYQKMKGYYKVLFMTLYHKKVHFCHYEYLICLVLYCELCIYILPQNWVCTTTVKPDLWCTVLSGDCLVTTGNNVYSDNFLKLLPNEVTRVVSRWMPSVKPHF